EIADRWILSKLNRTVREATENMEKFELGVAIQKIYDFIWDDYCDWYIELTKARLYGQDEAAKLTAQQVLLYVLDQILRLMHPFMPFVTEEIWQAIPHTGEALIVADWPRWTETLDFPQEEQHMESVMLAIRTVRNRRSEMNVPPSKKADLYIVTEKQEVFTEGAAFITRLAYADRVLVSTEEPEGHEDMAQCVTPDAKLYLPLAQLVDLDKELERIAKEEENARKEIARAQGQLANEKFVSRAPANVIQAQRDKLEQNQKLLAQLSESRARLEKLKG
ncbi:MAG: class I tRNA ligase family protein, partial [Oscillospiraceae bacterium]|nr:class I tRNA ligase family protein [Oscillospiraceae bacterium]